MSVLRPWEAIGILAGVFLATFGLVVGIWTLIERRGK